MPFGVNDEVIDDTALRTKGPLEDVARSIPGGVAKGVAGLVGMPADLSNLAYSGVRRLMGATPEQAQSEISQSRAAPGLFRLPTSGDVNSAIQGVTGDYYQPETTAGKYAETIASFLPNAVSPGGVVRKAAQVVLPGALSEAGGQLTKGTMGEPWARLGGALAGGGIASIRGGGGAAGVVRQAVKGATDDDIALARVLMSSKYGQIVKPTIAESLDEVTRGRTRLASALRLAERTPEGAAVTAPVMAARPGNVKTGVEQFLADIAPATDAPSAIGPVAKKTAQGGLDAVRKAINAEARPYYDTLRFQELHPSLAADLVADPSYAQALQSLRKNPELGAEIAGLPDTNLAVTNAVVKDLYEGASVAKTAGENRLSALRGGAADEANNLAKALSPEYAKAREVYSTRMGAEYDPLAAGPIGSIAATEDVAAQARSLFPKSPLEGAGAETADAIKRLGPVGAALSRQYLAREFAESSRDLVGGPNVWGGAKFAKGIAGNTEQEKALLSGLGALPNGQAISTDAQDLIRALRATGRRQPAGSPTSADQVALEGLQGPGIAETAARGINLPGILRRVEETISRIQLGREGEKLAKILTANPDEAERFLLSVKGKTPEQARAAAVAALARLSAPIPKSEDQ